MKQSIPISSMVFICSIILTIMIFTWIAGRQSAKMEIERSNHELQRLSNALADAEVQLERQSERIHESEAKQGSNAPSRLLQQKKLQDSLSRAQAAVQQYKDILVRESEQTAGNSVLSGALGHPGVKFFSFRNSEGEPASVYAFLVGGTRVVFVSSKLPPPPGHRQYQLWGSSKEASAVSLGVFTSEAEKQIVASYDEDQSLIADLSHLFVTEEPANGSSAPSGRRILETVDSTQ